MIDARKIDPKLHESYSPNLYRFVRRHPLYSDVFRSQDGRLYIGARDDFGDVLGAQLGEVLSFGGRAQTWAYCLHDSKAWESVNLWPSYLKIGRCAIDPSHTMLWVDGQKRYDPIDDEHKRCRWCGAVLTLRKWTVEVERSAWELI